MKTKLILVIMKQPLLREGLKYLIEESGVARVVTAPAEQDAERLVAEMAPDVVVIERGDTAVNNLSHFFHWQDKPSRVVVLGWKDDKLAVYSRWPVLPATVENLIRAITETGER